MKLFFRHYKKEMGLIIGLLLSILCFVFNPFSISYLANQVLSIAILMIVWWVFEAMPIAIVSLLPIVLFPLFNISTLKEVSKSYTDPIIFLFIGGFFMALAIEKWNLHKKIALSIITISGTNGNRIILGFIIATGFLSLWLSNTATTMMMFPIALSVIHIIKAHNSNEKNVNNFSLALMLSIAYASNLAIGNIIATPPNVAYVGFVKEKFNYSINFLDWIILFMPLTIILLAVLYWVLVKILYPNNIEQSDETATEIKKSQMQLGPLTVPQKRVLMIFSLTVFLWITKDFINRIQTFVLFDDNIIAILGAILMFLIPSGNLKNKSVERLMTWVDAKNMAWDILLLFGGGIALANALETSNLVNEFGSGLVGFSTNNVFIIILIVTTLAVFLSEVISNLALVIILSPMVSSLAVILNIDPLLLGIPMTLGASCACMLPIGTPPNAIVFAKGHIKIEHMIRTGFILNIFCILLISVFCWLFIPMILSMKAN